MTYREQFDSAMKCTTKAEADKWMADEVARYGREYGYDEAEARYIISANLGYMAGYCDHATAQKVHDLFGAAHPVFGSADYHETMTPKQCFDAGIASVEAMKSETKP